MSIEDRLNGVTGWSQRAAVKALGLAEAIGSSYSWSRGQYSATATSVKATAECLTFHLVVARSNAIVFEDDIAIVNPPLKINSGSDGSPVFVESAAGVLVSVVRDVLAAKGVTL